VFLLFYLSYLLNTGKPYGQHGRKGEQVGEEFLDMRPEEYDQEDRQSCTSDDQENPDEDTGDGSFLLHLVICMAYLRKTSLHIVLLIKSSFEKSDNCQDGR
jgi:hypothetical protein